MLFFTVKVIQRRWKNLRACFSRELRCQKDVKSGQAAPKRKRYVYFDKLLFLVPSMEPGRETSSNVTSLDEEAISENDSSTPAITRPTKEKKKNKCYEESLLEILRDKTNHQNIQTPPDPDNYFALSLVPLLKSIPPDQKIDAQIAILNTLKYYTPSSSNYNNYNSTAATYILPQPQQPRIISQQIISSAQPAPAHILSQPIMSTTQPQSQPPPPPPRVLSQQYINPSAPSTSTQSFYDKSPPRSNETVQSYVSNYSVDDCDIANFYASD